MGSNGRDEGVVDGAIGGVSRGKRSQDYNGGGELGERAKGRGQGGGRRGRLTWEESEGQQSREKGTSTMKTAIGRREGKGGNEKKVRSQDG